MKVFFKKLVHKIANIGQFYIVAFIVLYICTKFGKLTYLLVEPVYELLVLFILLILIDMRNMSNAQNSITLHTREALIDLVETLKIGISTNYDGNEEQSLYDFTFSSSNKNEVIDHFICKESDDDNIVIAIHRDEAQWLLNPNKGTLDTDYGYITLRFASDSKEKIISKIIVMADNKEYTFGREEVEKILSNIKTKLLPSN